MGTSVKLATCLSSVPHFLQAALCCLGLREGLLEAQGWPPDLRLWLEWASPGLYQGSGSLKIPQLLPHRKLSFLCPGGWRSLHFATAPGSLPPAVCPDTASGLNGCFGLHVDGPPNLEINFPGKCFTVRNVGAGAVLSLSSAQGIPPVSWWGGSSSLPTDYLTPTAYPWLCSRGSPRARSHPVE